MKILSGIQPSGCLHLGNYLGAIKQQIELQAQGEQVTYFIADLHALTVLQEPKKLANQILSVAAMYLALGLDPARSTLFLQSSRPEHCELQWILLTLTNLGELERMTQFKEKGRGIDRARVNVGLFAYPTLMAADILLYQTEEVPVGEDQVQHIELTRDLAKRFNSRFGETFTLPKPRLIDETKRILGLDDPANKMSKSAISTYNYIALTDTADTVRQKIRKAVTDSGNEIEFSDDKQALKNLLTIFAGVTDRTIETIVAEYTGKGYAEFKESLANEINKFLAPVQARYDKLIADEQYLAQILKDGTERVQPVAAQTLKTVKEQIGLITLE
ncbi:tryptophan--tRNA ligase [Candidatus Berkelbacteria bacterium]|nr:tryptophan--tRNA ligase [Candidatus Berkelbacteria bacterium]